MECFGLYLDLLAAPPHNDRELFAAVGAFVGGIFSAELNTVEAELMPTGKPPTVLGRRIEANRANLLVDNGLSELLN